MNFGENCLKLKIANIFNRVDHGSLKYIHPKLLSKILVNYDVKVAHNISNRLELATFSQLIDDHELKRYIIENSR